MKAFSVLLVLGIALATSGCGGMLKGAESAGKGVAEFHQMYNGGKLAEIYASGHPKLKAASEEKEFIEFLGAVQRKLGKVTQTSTTSSNVRSMNLTTTVVLKQSTTFEHGAGIETFTFEMVGDKAVLLGYAIDSKELILK